MRAWQKGLLKLAGVLKRSVIGEAKVPVWAVSSLRVMRMDRNWASGRYQLIAAGVYHVELGVSPSYVALSRIVTMVLAQLFSNMSDYEFVIP